MASTNLNGSSGVTINLSHLKAIDLATLQDPLAIACITNWSWGTGANQANCIFHDQRTLADGANETLDLYASGSLLDPFGDALTMTALKLLYLRNYSSDANLLVCGGTSADIPIFSNNSDQLIIKPGGYFLWTDPTAAGSVITTNKNLKLTHDGTGSSTLTYDVIALGLD